VLLDIATGRKDVFTAIDEFIMNVPWEDLEMVDVSVAEFFVEG